MPAGVSTSPLTSSSLGSGWSPARNFLYSKNYTPPFDSYAQALQELAWEHKYKKTQALRLSFFVFVLPVGIEPTF